ncbi:hypothetical protein CSQ96_26435 [Janthinobacterium sp. BJB412]|nr:hypothetical protein CSQ96_26435 [Janthinobacterium sp. BJB412]
MRLGVVAVGVDEVLRQRDLAGQVGMPAVDAAVDHRHQDVAAGAGAVQLGHVPVARRRLHRIQRGDRAGARRCGGLSLVQRHRLRPFGAWIVRQYGGDARGVVAGREAHQVAVQAERGHRPIAEQGQAMAARQLGGDAAARAAAAVVDVAAAVVGVGAVVRRGQAQHDQHLALGGADGVVAGLGRRRLARA